MPPTPQESLLQKRVEGMLASKADALVRQDREAELALVLTGLAFVDALEDLRRVADHLTTTLLDRRAESRRGAGEIFTRLLGILDGEAQAVLVHSLADPLRHAVLDEEDPTVLSSLPTLIGAWSRTAIVLEHWALLSKLYSEGIQLRLARPGTPASFGTRLQAELQELGESERQRVLEFLRHAPTTLLVAIQPVLGVIGDSAIGDLKAMVLDSSRLERAREAASVLGGFNASAADAIGRELQPNTARARCLRILKVLDVLRPPNLTDVLTAGLGHPEEEVRAEARAVLRHMGMKFASSLIHTILGSGDEGEAFIGAAAAAREFELTGTVPALVQSALGVKSPAAFEAALKALAAFPKPQSLPAYRAVFERASFLAPLGDDRYINLRALATHAAAKVDSPEAREIMALASKSKGKPEGRG